MYPSAGIVTSANSLSDINPDIADVEAYAAISPSTTGYAGTCGGSIIVLDASPDIHAELCPYTNPFM